MAYSRKSEALESVKQSIETNNVCPELMASATNLVFGDGDPNSSIVFIGEAPGKAEDKTGLPFVGAAGKFLNEMLEMIGLQRSEVYITNIVKYRPPNNRDPLPEEKKAFLPYLQRQLEIIQPKVVVALGRHAANCFLPQLRISEGHGKAKRITLAFSDHPLTIVLLPLFHPAAALYNGSMRQTLIDDFALIPEIINRVKDANKVLSTQNY
ncbi:MAG: uracil-DNA glycosylase [Candidatus Saccharimonadales bacterium]